MGGVWSRAPAWTAAGAVWMCDISVCVGPTSRCGYPRRAAVDAVGVRCGEVWVRVK